jgi:PAS domain S-box-containing protein
MMFFRSLQRCYLDLPIGKKLRWMVVASTGGALLIMTLLLATYEWVVANRGMAAKLSAQADILSANTTAAIEFQHQKDAEEVLGALQSDDEVLAAWIFLPDGRVFAGYQRDGKAGEATPPVPPTGSGRVQTLKRMMVFRPVLQNGEVVGCVGISAHLSSAWWRIVSYGGVAGLIMLGAIGVALAISGILQRAITQPVGELIAATRRVSLDRNYSLRVPRQSGDELGVLVDGFNGMMGEVQARDGALSKARDDLEQRVRERTAELQRQITERLQAEVELRLSERRFHQLFQSSPVAVCLSTIEEGRYLEVNEQFSRTFGYSRAELLGRTSVELGLWEDLQQRQSLVREILQGRPVRNQEMRFRTQSGKLLQTLIYVELFEWSQGPCLLFCLHDLTERQHLEIQLRQAQKMEAVGQLAAGVAHDFNNILTVIQGNASLEMDNECLPPSTREALRQVIQAAGRCAALTRQLLTFSRKQVMQPRLLDMNEVVTNLIKMLMRALRENIHMCSRLEGNLPAIMADVGMIEQVLTNLAVNARDAMPEGGDLVVETKALTIQADYAQQQPQARPGRYVRLRVSDTGTGMTPAVKARIFEPFFTTKEVGKGTGLGLATVFGIVEQHRGWIEVESEPGRGTTFDLFWPATEGLVTAPEEARAAVVTVKSGQGTILVVEDEPGVRSVVRHILNLHGYTVIEAVNGKAALRLWEERQGRIDLLLTDMVMPEGVSGRQLARQLREQEPKLAVVYMSGYSVDINHKEMQLQEGVDFLSKPFKPVDLVKVVARALKCAAQSDRT